MTNVANSLTNNLEFTKDPNFVSSIVAEIKKKKAKVVRIHVAGDFYSTEYIESWIDIVKALPEVKFFAFTRSWRVSNDYVKKLTALASLSNIKLWLSADKDTGRPVSMPNTKVAYMQVYHDDIPNYSPDLVFRDKKIRNKVIKRIVNAMVCPVENGTAIDITCSQCAYCWRHKGDNTKLGKDTSNRKALKVIDV